jgi:hypothetical protein
MRRYNILHCTERYLRFTEINEKRSIDYDYEYIGDVEADSLEQAFGFMNIVDEPDFTNYTPADKRFKYVRSLSVGDILKLEDRYFAVDNAGWSEVIPTYDEELEEHFIEPEDGVNIALQGN